MSGPVGVRRSLGFWRRFQLADGLLNRLWHSRQYRTAIECIILPGICKGAHYPIWLRVDTARPNCNEPRRDRHSRRVSCSGEGSLEQFSTSAQEAFPAVAADATSIRIDRVAFCLLIDPRLGSPIGFADVAPDLERLQIVHCGAAVMALVRHDLLDHRDGAIGDGLRARVGRQ